MNILEEVYWNVRKENLYLDWYTQKTVASILYQLDKNLHALIFGPPLPDYKKNWQASLSSEKFTDFEMIIEGLFNKFRDGGN